VQRETAVLSIVRRIDDKRAHCVYFLLANYNGIEDYSFIYLIFIIKEEEK